MARSIHVRLDDDSAAALRLLSAEAKSDSEAVRLALADAAARRLTRRSLRDEALKLADDEQDRQEMSAVRMLMVELSPDSPD